MGVLSELEKRFAESRDSPKFPKAWIKLQRKHPCLDLFDVPEDLRDFCQDPRIDYQHQDRVVLALCKEARAEARTRSTNRFATDLLFWIFVPALWKVADQAEISGLLDLDEIQALVVEGLWEKAIGRRTKGERLSGRLVNAGKHGVWKAIRAEGKEATFGLDEVEDEPKPDRLDPETADPWMLLCFAQLQGRIDEVDTELLFWTKLQDEPLTRVAPLLNLDYEAALSRTRRAKEKLALWIGQVGDDYPPRDPELARELGALAQKPSPLAHLLGRSRDRFRP